MQRQSALHCGDSLGLGWTALHRRMMGEPVGAGQVSVGFRHKATRLQAQAKGKADGCVQHGMLA